MEGSCRQSCIHFRCLFNYFFFRICLNFFNNLVVFFNKIFYGSTQLFNCRIAPVVSPIAMKVYLNSLYKLWVIQGSESDRRAAPMDTCTGGRKPVILQGRQPPIRKRGGFSFYFEEILSSDSKVLNTIYLLRTLPKLKIFDFPLPHLFMA